MLDVSKVYASGSNAWDTAVHDASEEYKHRMVNICSCGNGFYLLHRCGNSGNDCRWCFLPRSTTYAVITATRMSPWRWIWCDMKTAPRGTWSSCASSPSSTESMSGKEDSAGPGLRTTEMEGKLLVWCGVYLYHEKMGGGATLLTQHKKKLWMIQSDISIWYLSERAGVDIGSLHWFPMFPTNYKEMKCISRLLHSNAHSISDCNPCSHALWSPRLHGCSLQSLRKK